MHIEQLSILIDSLQANTTIVIKTLFKSKHCINYDANVYI